MANDRTIPLRCCVALGAAAAAAALEHLALRRGKAAKKIADLSATCSLVETVARGDVSTVDWGYLCSLADVAVDAAGRAKDPVERGALDAIGGAAYAASSYMEWAGTSDEEGRENLDAQVRDNVRRAVRGASGIVGTAARLHAVEATLADATRAGDLSDDAPAPI